MAELRYDIGTLRPAQRLADGRLRVDAYLTRSGVFHYRNADGSTRREYRPDGEVFRPASLASFADVVVTDDHPSEMVSASNARDLSVGFVSGAPRRDGDHVAATLVLNDADTIARVEAGKQEISLGYEVDLDETPGMTPDGERFDATQMNIRGNHVAIVEVARAGRSARMRLDALDQIPALNVKEPSVMTIEQLQAALTEANTKLGAATARADAADTKLVAAEAAAAAASARADASDKARTDAVSAEPARIRARVVLETRAAAVLGTEFKQDASDREIMVACVARLDSFEIADDASDEAVSLCYRNACGRADKGDASVDAVRFAVGANRGDAGSEADKARAEMLERNRNAYKPAK